MDTNLSVEDIKAMFADVARRFQETDRMFKESERRLQEESERKSQEAERRSQEIERRRQEESERRSQEAERRSQEIERRLQEESERRSQEAKRRSQEAERRSQEAERRSQELDRVMRAEWSETSKKIREVSQQIGGLGNKFGSFTEGLALPSMQKILFEKFKVDTVSPSVRVSRNGKHLEIDVLAYANGEVNTAYVMEVKSHLREDGIEQLLRILDEFPEWFPEHKNKRLFGILAAVDIPAALRPKVFEQGLYLARIHNDLFELQSAEAFVPRRFDKAALQ